MSDNVRFLTINGSGGSGYSGSNGFPFPTNYGAGSNELHPAAFSLQKCIEMWWRIYNYSITTDAQASISGSDVFVTNGPWDRFPVTPTRELDLIDPSNSPVFSDHGFGSFSIFAGPTDQLRYNGSFWPALSFASQLTGGIDDVLFTTQATPPTSSPPWTSNGSVSGTFAGTPVTFYSFKRGTVTSVTFTSMSIDPATWWPHAQLSDGLPVYNTSTGAILSGRSYKN